jgi:hypothetical protein
MQNENSIYYAVIVQIPATQVLAFKEVSSYISKKGLCSISIGSVITFAIDILTPTLDALRCFPDFVE